MGQFRLASLLLLLASQVNGQSLMQGLWAFAQASGVDPVAPADPGAFPPDPDAFPPDFGAFPPDSAVFPQDTGAFPPDSGAFPPDSGAFPPDTAVFPPDTGVFPPDTAVFPPDTGVFPQDTGSTQPDTGAAFPPDTRSPPPKDTGAFPPDSAAIPSEPNKDPASNPAGVDITGGKGAAGSAGKVNSPFISEPKTVSDIGQNALEKPVLDPANSAIVTGQGGHVPVVDPFGVGSGSSGKDPSLVSSSSIGMVDMITNEVQTPVEPALPILPTGGTESTGIGILTDMGLNLGLDTGLSVDASSSFGIADIIPGNAMDLPVQEIPIVPPVNSQDLPRTGQDTGFVVEPDFIPVSNTDAGSEMVIPIIGPGSIPDIGTMVDNIVVPDHPKPQPDSKPITAALEVPAPNQNTGSMSILDPSKARSFLNSLIGQPFNVDKVKPKTKATDIDVPTGWTQLYPNGRRPSKIEAGLSQLPSAVDAPAATETENQMADISNRSFGKHRNLYRQLRRERIEAKKALRNKLKQGRSGRGRSQGRQQGKGGQKTKAQALGMNKKRQRQFRTMPRRASLSIPVDSGSQGNQRGGGRGGMRGQGGTSRGEGQDGTTRGGGMEWQGGNRGGQGRGGMRMQGGSRGGQGGNQGGRGRGGMTQGGGGQGRGGMTQGGGGQERGGMRMQGGSRGGQGGNQGGQGRGSMTRGGGGQGRGDMRMQGGSRGGQGGNQGGRGRGGMTQEWGGQVRGGMTQGGGGQERGGMRMQGGSRGGQGGNQGGQGRGGMTQGGGGQGRGGMRMQGGSRRGQDGNQRGQGRGGIRMQGGGMGEQGWNHREHRGGQISESSLFHASARNDVWPDQPSKGKGQSKNKGQRGGKGKDKVKKPKKGKAVGGMVPVDLTGVDMGGASTSFGEVPAPEPPPGTEMLVLTPGGAPQPVESHRVEAIGGLQIVWK